MAAFKGYNYKLNSVLLALLLLVNESDTVTPSSSTDLSSFIYTYSLVVTFNIHIYV